MAGASRDNAASGLLQQSAFILHDQVSHYLSTSPLRGVSKAAACPESKEILWQWFNVTLPNGAQQYLDEKRIIVTCIDYYQ